MKSWAQTWLELQCRMISNVRQGVVMLGKSDDGPFLPLAIWPSKADDLSEITTAANSALASRSSVIARPEGPSSTQSEQRTHVAYPIIADNHLLGVVAVDIAQRSPEEQQTIVDLLAWGANWLKWFLSEHEQLSQDKLTSVLAMIASSLEDERFQAAAMRTVSDLAARLECERVSIGFADQGHARLSAISNSARFAGQSNLVRDIEAAMDEAMDQGATIAVPSPEDKSGLVSLASAELARKHDSVGICITPFGIGGRVLGALAFESSRPLQKGTIALCEHAASLIGPILEAKRRADKRLMTRTADSLRDLLSRLFGRRHYGLKAAAASLLTVACVLAFTTADYRIKAPASLEGSVQRAIVAPMDGYVADASVRAGDTVAEGELVARLDDKDLNLERLKWVSRLEQLQKEYRSALATHERAQVRILGAKIDQAEAELSLLREQLSRVRLQAPFDGVVVSGDLSQSLGSPVERGQVLFEIAPLDSYRIVLRVGENDFAAAEVGQRGELVLSALPGERFGFRVSKITPVAAASDGQNNFRVEAELERAVDQLQPGMEGIGKVSAGRRSLLWIWTHRLFDWLRLAVWSWWP